MFGLTHLLSAISALWVLAAIQGSTHVNPEWTASSGDVPSRSKAALIKAPQPVHQDEIASPAPQLGPMEVAPSGRIEPVLVICSLLERDEVVHQPQPHLLFPTGLSPPAARRV